MNHARESTEMVFETLKGCIDFSATEDTSVEDAKAIQNPVCCGTVQNFGLKGEERIAISTVTN